MGNFNPWLEKISDYRNKFSTEIYLKNSFPYKYFFKKLSTISKKPSYYSLDVGQNQMWASKYLHIKQNDRILNCGGLGSMGFSLPAAIGGYFANKKANHIVMTGDGGLQVNIQELETVSHYKIPL